MKKYLISMVLAVFLVSCAGGKTKHFPSNEYSADLAEVTVIREKRFIGFTLKIILDENVIARLGPGQYLTFHIEPGIHDIGLPNHTISVVFRSGQKHYILVKAAHHGSFWGVERISDQKAQFWMAKSRSIQ